MIFQKVIPPGKNKPTQPVGASGTARNSWLQSATKRGIMVPSEEKDMHSQLCACTMDSEERPPDL